MRVRLSLDPSTRAMGFGRGPALRIPPPAGNESRCDGLCPWGSTSKRAWIEHQVTVRLNDFLEWRQGLAKSQSLSWFGSQSALDRGCKCERIGEKNKSITQARPQISAAHVTPSAISFPKRLTLRQRLC